MGELLKGPSDTWGFFHLSEHTYFEAFRGKYLYGCLDCGTPYQLICHTKTCFTVTECKKVASSSIKRNADEVGICVTGHGSAI